jgi:hypothetical protein
MVFIGMPDGLLTAGEFALTRMMDLGRLEPDVAKNFSAKATADEAAAEPPGAAIEASAPFSAAISPLDIMRREKSSFTTEP